MITAELRLRSEGPLRDPWKRLSEGALARQFGLTLSATRSALQVLPRISS
jgi:hypothetical protein